MPCYHPVECWWTKPDPATGKRRVVFNRKEAGGLQALKVPCGGCIGCRLERSRQWAIRCMHEQQQHLESVYGTFTYDDEHLPANGSLDRRHFPGFMKRLRKAYPDRKLKYFHCGEYGGHLERPHYHAIIWGVSFPDRRWYKKNARGDDLWISDELQKLWGHGFVTIGAVTFESAAYVARYVMKKVTGDRAERHYQRIDPSTGEVYELEPEYVTMSLRPAVGKAWIQEFRGDVYPDDFIVTPNGTKAKVPAYYDKQLSDQEREEIKAKRRARASDPKLKKDNTPERLAVREEVKAAQIKQLKRDLK